MKGFERKNQLFSLCGLNCGLCPICNNKTRTEVREDTELVNFPFFCPKCKHEILGD
jgi:hypothetical protein